MEPNTNCGLLCNSRANQANKTMSKKSPVKSMGGSVHIGENRMATNKIDVVADDLSSYGFNAADWLNNSFTDENSGSVKPLSCSSANKGNNNKSTGPRFKIYEDRGGCAPQTVANQSLKHSSARVLSDRTNVAHRSSQMWTKNSSSIAKRTLETLGACKENDGPTSCGPSKTCGIHITHSTGVIGSKNSTKNGVKLPCKSVDCDDIHVEVSSHTCVIALSSSTVTSVRTEMSSAVALVTASCPISSVVTSSLSDITCSSVTCHSDLTSTVGSHISIPNVVSYASSVSSVTICSTVLVSESAQHQTVGRVRSSFICSTAVPQLCPSSIRTPQNQSSVRSSYGTKFLTPGTTVTPCNQPIYNSTMKPTPPMCSCGCRAKRKYVQSPGQNMGRPFYCCGASTRTSKKGCNFFKWESSCSVTPVGYSSEVTPLTTRQFLSMRTASRSANFTARSSSHAQQSPSFSILVPPSFK